MSLYSRFLFHPLFRSQPTSQRVEVWEKQCHLCVTPGREAKDKSKRNYLHRFLLQIFLASRNIDLYHSLRLMVNGRTLREIRWRDCQFVWVPPSIQHIHYTLQYCMYNCTLYNLLPTQTHLSAILSPSPSSLPSSL